MEKSRGFDTCLVHLLAEDYKDAIEKIGNELVKKGYVKPEYIEAVIERERKYPTGLNVQGAIKVAIPHADCCHVNEPQIAFASLKKPVSFRDMEDPSKSIDVKIVFMLAIKEPNQQVEVLQKCMDIFQDEKQLKQLFELKEVDQVQAIINNKLC